MCRVGCGLEGNRKVCLLPSASEKKMSQIGAPRAGAAPNWRLAARRGGGSFQPNGKEQESVFGVYPIGTIKCQAIYFSYFILFSQKPCEVSHIPPLYR